MDPGRINDYKDWYEAFRGRAPNVVFGKDNTLLVLNPRVINKRKPDPALLKEAMENPVKIIPHMKGIDYLEVLSHSETMSEELRARALKKKELIEAEMTERIATARDKYTEAEQAMITAINNWENATDKNVKKRIAMDVGNAMHLMQETEAELRAAQYPIRYIKQYNRISYGLLHTGTGIKKAVQSEIYGILAHRTKMEDRAISIEEGKA